VPGHQSVPAIFSIDQCIIDFPERCLDRLLITEERLLLNCLRCLTCPAIAPAVNMGMVAGTAQLQVFAVPVKRSSRSLLAHPNRPVREMVGNRVTLQRRYCIGSDEILLSLTNIRTVHEDVRRKTCRNSRQRQLINSFAPRNLSGIPAGVRCSGSFLPVRCSFRTAGW